MITVSVNASKNYQVIIGSDLSATLIDHIKLLGKTGKAAIISDSNVFPIYGKMIDDALQKAGMKTCSYVLPAGEESKNGANYLSILDFLAQNQLTRSDMLVALGGGVIGDITGFAAATYLRGISFIQIPTSLLAMVDSSVGGKTAIDLPTGKNLAGAFYQPDLVLCDVKALDTLPQDVFIDGCAEVIKYGILYDPDLFEHLYKHGLDFDREAVIARCVALKRDVVAEDEYDTGARQKLNLGHTIGHGIEAYSGYTVTHGKAVAIGTVIVSKAGTAKGICDSNTARKITAILERFGLPLDTTATAEQLFRFALSDKKRAGSKINLIVPHKIGDCIIHPIAVEDLQAFIKAGL